MSKLTSDMSLEEMAYTFCEGDLGAAAAILAMANGNEDVYFCDSLDIRGEKIFKLLLKCCHDNSDKFNRTLMMLRCGIFSEEQIQSNLDLVRAMPFIDDSIVIEGVPPYGEDFGPTDEKWDEFCSKNKEAFTKKLDAILEQQKGHNSSGPKM